MSGPLVRVRGDIRRRVLVNFRVDPDRIGRLLPRPFEPKLVQGSAIAGICLIRLDNERPVFLPALFGLSSENAAHRIAVTWMHEGQQREGVYIPRRDTNSRLNRILGGRLFPGEHQAAIFNVRDDGRRIDLSMRSVDGSVGVELHGSEASSLPASSVFASLESASAFFAAGSLGYSATAKGDRLDAVELAARDWRVRPLSVEQVRSSFFDDVRNFPVGSVAFDSALVMRDIRHEWHARDELYLDRPRAAA